MWRRCKPWLAIAAAWAVVVSLATPAHACPETILAWAARCAAEAGVVVVPERCAPGRLVALLEPGPHALRVELRAGAGETAFRRSGAIGVSPVGSFADWSQEPAWRRSALERVVGCVDRIGAPPWDVVSPGAPFLSHDQPILLLCGLLLCLAVVAWRFASERLPRRVWLALAGLTCGGVALRCLLVPDAAFHQNGQGAMWVGQAVGLPELPQIYGPGFVEALRWLVAGHPGDADVVIHGFMTLLFGVGIPCLWLVGRLVGGAAAAWVASGVFACHPLVARLSRSESYYALGLGLTIVAAAALASGFGRATRRPDRGWMLAAVGALGAGCLVAQAARIHPVIWLPATTLPFVAACLPATASTRVARALAASAAIGAVVLVAAVPAMLVVLRGELGQQWLPRSRFPWPELPELALVLALFAASRRRAEDLVPALASGICLWLLLRTNTVTAGFARITRAYAWLYLPATAASLGAAVVGITGKQLRWGIAAKQLRWGIAAKQLRWGIAGGLGAIALAVELPEFGGYLTLPTDVREDRLVRTWRAELPEGATVAYLSRADDRIVSLPLFDAHAVTAVAIKAHEPLPLLPAPDRLYYVRTSLCVTPEGRAACRELEARLALQPLHEELLPAVPSHPWQPLGAEPVPVGLFRVTAIAAGAATPLP